MNNQDVSDTDIAIVGIGCRFPNCKNADEFWDNLCNGVECILPVSDEQLREELQRYLGYIPEPSLTQWLNDAHYVRAAAGLDNIDLFDAPFFGYNSTEAGLLDPQQRLFLECAWEALEDAGYNPDVYTGLIGVYAGTEMSTYHHSLHTCLLPTERDILTILGNAGDYLTTRVSYKLNLKGPSFDIQSACSTSLVAVHVACQSLKNGECDIALAGGVVAYSLQNVGYLSQEGGLFAQDGHCRPFDAKATGTVFANGGVGVVILKRLNEALADGDAIYAVIKGAATNNDGAVKTGYTAPSVGGQVKVLSEALAVAGIDPASISYIEAHGTGTPLGDPIEIAALTQCFQRKTQKKSFCAIGSVKSNVGHLGAASGVAGLIKTALALKHKMLPPSLHYTDPNPQIDFANSPFYVNNKLSSWEPAVLPRRAGVNSFGMGGSNAHVILEEAPLRARTEAGRPWQLLLLSAKSSSALEIMTTNLASYLKGHADLDLADVAFTLQSGRKVFPHRRLFVCSTLSDAVRQLENGKGSTSFEESRERLVTFMFSGQGSQYVNMGLELYQQEPTFREQVDKCSELLKPWLGFDLRSVIYPSHEQEESARQQINQTFIAQPALFVIEFALATLWMNWGIYPRAMIGHSIGEYVAACLAGVFSLEDALALVALRGRMMQELPEGAMLTISLSSKEVQAFLGPSLSLAVVNSLTDCVVSGPLQVVEQLEQQLNEKEIPCHRLHTSHAFHSQMMEPILADFTAAVKKVRLSAPTLPYISNVTGSWILAEEATDPLYWAMHLRQTVRFAEGLHVIQEAGETALLEIGPGRTLATLARRYPGKRENQVVVSSLRHPRDQEADVAFLLKTCGQLWCTGVAFNWPKVHAHEQRQRISLPTYPFERKRYWVFPKRQDAPVLVTGKKPDLADWFSIPSWNRSALPVSENKSENKRSWLFFTDSANLGNRLIKRLEEAGEVVISVLVGEQFSKVADRVYRLNPQQRDNYAALFRELRTFNTLPMLIVHLWTVLPALQLQQSLEFYERTHALGFYSLLYLAQELGEQNITDPLQITILSNNLQDVVGGEVLCPLRATVFGPAKVIAYEYPNITCRTIDVIIPETDLAQEKLIDQLLAELQATVCAAVVAYRGPYRWVQTFEALHLEKTPGKNIRLRERGVYLITGGFGGIGLTLAEHLVRTSGARLVLTARTPLPPRQEWEQWLANSAKDKEASRRIRQVQFLEALGAEVLVLSTDVTSYEEMQNSIRQVYSHFGCLHGVIHAAGVPGGGIIQLKAAEAAANVLAPKVKGTLVLEAVLKNAELDFILLCSSIYSITGGLGQVDYCAGNAFLDSFSFYNLTKNNVLTVSINWDAWQEVGMAVNAGAVRQPQQVTATSPLALASTSAAAHPLLAHSTLMETGEYVFTTELQGTKHWVLDEHRIQGVGAISGTTYLEMVRAAFVTLTQSEMLEIGDVFFFTPLTVGDEEVKELRLSLKQEGNGFHFLITSKAMHQADVVWLRHAEGNVSSLFQASAQKFEIDSCKRRVEMVPLQGDQVKNDVGFMQYGPRWEVLQRKGFSGDEGLALLELAEKFSADLEILKLHPALLDIATSFAAYQHVEATTAAYLPLSYKRLRIHGSLPARLYSYARQKAESSSPGDRQEFLIYDLILMDEEGTMLVEIEDFCLRRVQDTTLPLQASARNATATSAKNEGRKQQFRKGALDNGILPHEGTEAFERILSLTSLPQVIVSARDIQALLKKPDASSELFSAGVSKAEQMGSSSADIWPGVRTAYVAPRTELELQIATIWQKVLGIDKVGMHDNFFEIGGDSVMILQIIRHLRTEFQVELSMNMIFDAPTISGVAEIIMRKQMELLDQEQLAELLENLHLLSDEDALLQIKKNSLE